MRTLATIVVILLTMPVSYAMLDETMRKLNIGNVLSSRYGNSGEKS